MKKSLTSTKFTLTYVEIFKKSPENVFIFFSFVKFAICSLKKKKKSNAEIL